MAYVSLPTVPLTTCPAAPYPIQSVSHISESDLSNETRDVLEAKGVRPIFILVHNCDRIDPDDVISLFKLDAAAATYITRNLGIMKPKDVARELADGLGSRTNTNDLDTAAPGVS